MLRKRICAACLCLSLLLGTAPAAYGAEMEPDEVPTEAAEAERTEVSETSTEAEALEAPTTEPVETVPEAPEEPEALEDSKETEKPEMVGAGTEAGEPAEQMEYPVEADGIVLYPVEGGNIEFDPETGKITNCSREVTNAVIPSSINGVAVTAIGKNAFRFCHIKYVTIPDSVTTIESYAFQWSRLRKVVIPNSVTSIWPEAFSGCTNLTSIVIPSGTGVSRGTFSGCGIKSAGPIGGGYDCEFGWTDTIFDGAFENCAKLTRITLPDSITHIGRYAFRGCSELASITIPNSVSYIGPYAFQSCSKLNGVVIPDGVTRIDDFTFSGCAALDSIVIPASVTKIGDQVFSGCAFESAGPIGGNYGFEFGWTSSIPHGVFTNFDKLTRAAIPAGVTKIKAATFAGCTSLESVAIPAGVTEIQTNAFFGCSALTDLTIPNSVKWIMNAAFANCTSLKEIVLPGGITQISSGTFNNCTALESVTIPAGVTEIAENVFSGCTALRNIYYTGGEERWETVEIRSGNEPLTDAALHTLPTHSFVAILGTWNPTLDQVTFSNIMSLTTPYYKVTSQSVTPSEGLAASVGRYVLAEVSGDEIVSIQRVESRLGRLEALSSESLTLDGTRYPSQVDISKYAGTLGDLVVCHLWGGQAVGLQVPAEKTGKLASWDGSTVSGLGGTAVIDKSSFPTGSITDLSFLGSVTRLLGRTVRYWTLDGKLLRMEKEDERWTESKRFQRYDRASGTVFFQDGTSRRTAEGLTVPSLTAGRWVICEVEDSQETGGARITAMRAIEPHVTVNVVLSGGPVEYRSGKLRFVGGQYVGKTSFEIPVRVEVSNDSSVPGQLTGAVREDKSLWMTVNKVTLTAPDGFNFGWLGGGAVELDSPVTLAPGEAWSGQGYLRANASFSPKSPDSRYALQAVAETSAGTRAAGANLRVLIPGKEPSDETRKLAVNAARLLDETSSRVNILLPDAEKMLRDLGIEGDSLDTFSKLLLTEIIMSGAPEETFQEHVNRETLEKLFKYKPDLGVDHYTLPLTFVVDTEKYGRVTLRVNCDVSNFTLSGDRYALSAQVDYQILSSEKDCPWKEGRVGQVFDADVDSYAKAAYDVAEAEIKNQYNKVWGNGADAVCDLIFGSSVTAILEEHDTTYKDEIWKLATWPSKSLRVSQKSAGNKRLALSSPIGVYVYDEAGQLRGVMEQYQVLKCDGDFTLRADDGDICIDGLAEGYTVRYAVSENVEAEVAVTELAGYGSPLREVVFSGLSLDAGKQYTQTVSAALLPDKDSYRLSEDGGAALAEGREQMLVTLRPAAAGTLESAVLESGGVRVSYTAERGRLIAAAYRADGKLLDVSAASLDGSGSVRVKLNTAGASYVTAALADQESWRPLCPNLRIPAGG